MPAGALIVRAILTDRISGADPGWDVQGLDSGVALLFSLLLAYGIIRTVLCADAHWIVYWRNECARPPCFRPPTKSSQGSVPSFPVPRWRRAGPLCVVSSLLDLPNGPAWPCSEFWPPG